MMLKDYIANDFKALSPETTISEASSLLASYPFSHFNIVENKTLVGLVHRDDIDNAYNKDLVLNELKPIFQFFRTLAPDNFFDLASLFAQHATNILPVTDVHNVYLGYYELEEVMQFYNNTPFFQKNSTTLVIQKQNNDYTISEIVQIIENNKVQILGLFISSIDSTNTEITLRLGTEYVNEVIQSLRRYDYQILTTIKDDIYLEQLQENADYLNKYLEI